jgi:hypothetical protein
MVLIYYKIISKDYPPPKKKNIKTATDYNVTCNAKYKYINICIIEAFKNTIAIEFTIDGQHV